MPIATPSFNFSNAYNSKALLQVNGEEGVSYWIKEFSIPAIEIDKIKSQRTPYSVAHPGNIINYPDFSVTFYNDENWLTYMSLYNWFFGAVNGPDFVDPKRTAQIIVLDNSLKNIIIKFNFKDLMIGNLPEVTFNNYEAKEVFLTCGFSYTNMVPETLT